MADKDFPNFRYVHDAGKIYRMRLVDYRDFLRAENPERISEFGECIGTIDFDVYDMGPSDYADAYKKALK